MMCQYLFKIKAKLHSFTSKGGRSQLYTELLKTGSDLYIGGLTGRRATHRSYNHIYDTASFARGNKQQAAAYIQSNCFENPRLHLCSLSLSFFSCLMMTICCQSFVLSPSLYFFFFFPALIHNSPTRTHREELAQNRVAYISKGRNCPRLVGLSLSLLATR